MSVPFSCDTSVALGSATADGSTILAKNSDRSPNESQPLTHIPGSTHPAGATVRCQYIEIPQVEQTWEVIGSRPCWLWGFEMGVNEWGVAIGNEAVLTREPSEEVALIGMDIVRLALERAATADEAVQVMGELIERYGQGGSCEESYFRTYHNSFIVADPSGAWIVETAGHRWVAKRVQDRAAIGNLLAIGQRWDAGSPGIAEHAIASGWATEPFNFADSYRDPEADLSTRTCRLDRARAILGGYSQPITVTDMMSVLKDHGDRDLPTGAERLPTLCMHASPGLPDETAAAMVAHLRPGKPKEITAPVWTAFGSPCLSVFRPVYPFAVGLPEVLNIGTSRYSSDSPWWTFERLQRTVAINPSLASDVRSAFTELQQRFFDLAAQAEADAESMLLDGRRDDALRLLRDLVDTTTAESIELASRLLNQFESRGAVDSNPVMASIWAELNEKAGVPAYSAAGVSVARD
jgi:dipeptidase